MLTESEVRSSLGHILGLEEHGEQDWYAIASLSAELLQSLPESTPLIVKSYLADTDIRRVSRSFGEQQRSAIRHYLRS